MNQQPSQPPFARFLVLKEKPLGGKQSLSVFRDARQAAYALYDCLNHKLSVSPDEVPEGALEFDYLLDYPNPEALLHWWAGSVDGDASFDWMTEEELDAAAKEFYELPPHLREEHAYDIGSHAIIPNPFEDDEDEDDA